MSPLLTIESQNKTSLHDTIVGIDLGTTNSLVAVCENGIPRVLRDEENSSFTPSVVHWGKSDQAPIVGQDAKKKRIVDAAHTAYSVKRLIGRGREDLESQTASIALDVSSSTEKNILIKLGDRSLSAIELSAEILKRLKSVAEKSLNVPIKKAVITVPAYFNDSQRTATKVAATLAGLEVLRIVNEPTAAALAYGLDRKKNGLIAVYDLGGGTFDISILRLHDGIFEVLATQGDTALGGDDFDLALMALIIEKVKVRYGERIDGANLQTKSNLIESAEKLKISLSNTTLKTEKASVLLDWHPARFDVQVTRDEFESSIETLIQKTIQITKLTLQDAGLKKNEIDDIVLVGGSTRIPLVREQLRLFFEKELNTSVNPDEVVALGAAIQADILAGKNTEMVLLDVVPLSLGLEMYGGTIAKLIHRNTRIPAIAHETFTTHVDGQKNVLIHVLQGERELVVDCRSLAKFDLKGLPPMPAGLPKIQVTFLVNADGILTVTAKETTTNTQSSVEVRPAYGLTDEQVEKMLLDSFDHAEEDIRQRQLVDSRVEAEGVLRSADKILREALLEEDLKGLTTPVEAQMNNVKIATLGKDHVAIRDALEKLEEIAKPLAARVMDSALRGKLQQKNLNEILTPSRKD